jgi:hypothetical protein
MANELQFYNEAKAALAKAVKADEVKDIRNKSIALKLYAKQAADKTLEADAHEIRMRAERRLGEMMEAGKKDRASHGGDKRSKDSEKLLKPTLKEAGIDGNLANKARKAAAMPVKEFELRIVAEKEKIKSPPVVNIVSDGKTSKPKPPMTFDITEMCVESVREIVERAIRALRAEPKVRLLFQRLFDELRALENKTLPPKSAEESAEERRELNAKLAEEDEKIH